MKKGFIRGIVTLAIIFVMSAGVVVYANKNVADNGSSFTVFVDQQNRGEESTNADISDAIGTIKSYWYLYDGDKSGNPQISYAEIVDSGTRVAGNGVQFGCRSDYFWYTLSCDRTVNYQNGKNDTMVFGNLWLQAPTVKYYRYSNLIYEHSSYCKIRQQSKLTKAGAVENRVVKIYADGNYVTEVTKTFPRRDDNTTMVAGDVYVTNLYGPYFTWTSKVENGYYRIDLRSHYTVSASINANGSVSPASRTIDYGQSGSFTFTANEGFVIDYITDNGAKIDIANTTSYTYTVSNVTSAHSIVATTAPITYTVTYNGNGATSGSTASQTFAWGESKSLSANGFKREYAVTYNANGGSASKTSEIAAATFNGWEDRNNIIYNGVSYLWTTFDAPYYANAYEDLYNAFGYNKYSLIGHYVNNGMGENRNPKNPNDPNNEDRSYYRADRMTVSNLTTKSGETLIMHANWSLKSVVLPSASRTGYTFNGWYDGSKIIGSANSVWTPTATTTLTADWSPNIYKVTLDNQGATTEGTKEYWYMYETIVTAADGEILYYYSDKDCTTPIHNYTMVPPTKNGYTFEGYFTEKDGGGTQFILPSGECVNNIFQKRAADTTLYAKWTKNKYTIKWQNHDGALLYESQTEYGVTPVYGGNSPARTSDDEFDYTFSGWSPSVAPATDHATYTAQYNPTKRKYAITFKDEDGEILQTSSVAYGETPTYTGATPTKETTNTEIFTFEGWSPSISAVKGEAVYVATYTAETRYYSVTWKNGETVLATESYEYGETPSYSGETPTKQEDDETVYIFIGWSPAVSPVTTDLVYEATFEAVAADEATADLIIEVRGCKDGTFSFVFTVSGGADFHPLEVPIVGNNSATVKNLAIGEYTVSEEDGWSWRYDTQSEKSIDVKPNLNGTENRVVFDFSEKGFMEKWLSGLASLFK